MFASRTNRFFVFLLGALLTSHVLAQQDDLLSFPDDFLIGSASSAYQIEGAWNVANKSESIWDFHVHKYPERVADGSTGDVSTDHYHKYEDDVKLMQDLGLDHYRFSLSWTRLFPEGYPRKPNPEGVRFYHNLLDELLKRGIQPMVTIYHWDHPQYFERLFGGWLSEEMAYVYAEYARFVFREFGGKVKLFVTINEPHIMCKHGYGLDWYPPSVNQSGYADFRCIQNMLKGHALSYHMYDEEFRSKQAGKVGIVMDSFYFYSKNRDDLESADLAFEFEGGLVANPIFSERGDWSDTVKLRVAERSRAQGLWKSRLPEFNQEWIEYIRGSADFFGLNHYTSKMVEPLPRDEMVSWPNDEGFIRSADSNWIRGQSFWLDVVPRGFGDLLRTIKRKYNNPPVYVTENGVSDVGGLNDKLRIRYIYDYMREMLIAIKRDKCNVKAYTVWSLFDSFEWNQGYLEKFGLFQVDFNDTNRKRTPKKSVAWLKSVLKTRRLQPPVEQFEGCVKID